jgi:hypothetical protein
MQKKDVKGLIEKKEREEEECDDEERARQANDMQAERRKTHKEQRNDQCGNRDKKTDNSCLYT